LTLAGVITQHDPVSFAEGTGNAARSATTLGRDSNWRVNLVNVASSELPTMDRVAPGLPANSWLMHKLDGTQGTFTGQCPTFCGSSMPLGSPLLDASVRDAIRAWIADGATNDC